MPRVKLEGDAKTDALAKVPSWASQSGDNKPDSIFKKFAFKDFVAAFGFMSQVALVAEKVCTCSNALFLLPGAVILLNKLLTLFFPLFYRWITTLSGSTCTTAWKLLSRLMTSPV